MGSLGAELLKLRSRPATWALGLVLALIVLFFGYLIIYLLYSTLPPESNLPLQEVGTSSAEGTPPEEGPVDLLEALLPTKVLSKVLPLIHQFGGPAALILGALATGSEYNWGTLKTNLSQRTSRVGFLFAKSVALNLVLVVFAALALFTGALCSLAISVLEGAAVHWPSFMEMVEGAGAAAVILAAWSALGMFLATLFRGTSLSIGLGLVYVLALEGIVGSLLAQKKSLVGVREGLLGQNSGSLASAFGPASEASGSPLLVNPAQAALVLGAYAVGFVLLAAFLLRRRDVA